ncbi:MAG: exodeoxyribonuclease VII small subunit [Muribaculaceae bacterium]|mgnify:FL=1|jgi:exodeoxyribonuclease VII small subunit|nr:exodeoxyribonuclease VII small subunit [Muribaculaceae bacterium]MCI9117794.1 exodeoxyribonuclease VII small subunit [Muribaculaceae bacterium]
MKPAEELTYTEAVAELESIVAKLRGDNCDVDALTAMTRRAAELLAACRARLTATDAELRAILDSLESPQ